MTEGGFMRRFSSCMSVKPLGPDSCRMEMHMLMQPSIPVPMGIKSLVGAQVGIGLRAGLRAQGRVEGAGVGHAGVGCCCG